MHCQKVCKDFIDEYLENVGLLPTTAQERQELAGGFSMHWNFHNTQNGKYVAIRYLPIGGSGFFRISLISDDGIG